MRWSVRVFQRSRRRVILLAACVLVVVAASVAVLNSTFASLRSTLLNWTSPRFREAIIHPWSSIHSGWYAASTPYSDPDSFLPRSQNLAALVEYSALGDSDGLTLALYRPHFAVDGAGRVRVLNPLHFAALVGMSRDVVRLAEARAVKIGRNGTLPPGDKWEPGADGKDDEEWGLDTAPPRRIRSTFWDAGGWPVYRLASCGTGDTLIVPDAERRALRYAWIYAFVPGKRELDDGGQLPETVDEFFGLLEEPFHVDPVGWGRRERNEEMIQKVKAAVPTWTMKNHYEV